MYKNKKINVGIYIDNSRCSKIDFSHPEYGNPGSGGTEYLMASFEHYIRKYCNRKINMFTYAYDIDNFPDDYNKFEFKEEKDAIKHFISNDGDIYITRPADTREFEIVLETIEKLTIPTILWAHSRIGKINKRISESNMVRRFVCVGKQQFKRLIYDKDPLIKKATYIFNGFDSEHIIQDNTKINIKNVVYLGCLIESKGFHLLAEVWPDLIKEIPDAKLFVIGTGQLYDHNAKLGKYGIADEEYENKFIPHLLDENKNILKSVKFLGLVGKEKSSYLQDASVGVVNPSGITENCPGTALEFQSYGIPVVSGAYEGLLDTVLHNKTGLLGTSRAELFDNIKYLLQNPEIAKSMGRKGIYFVKKKFNYVPIIRKWEKEIEDSLKGKKPSTSLEVKLLNSRKFIGRIKRNICNFK